MIPQRERAPVLWLGLGQMGAPLCARAARSYRVSGVDPLLTSVPGLWRRAENLAQLDRDTQPWAIVLCLPSVEGFLTTIEQIVSSPALADSARALVNLSTVGPQAAEQARLLVGEQAAHMQYVESLMTGGVLGAKHGQITLLVGSEAPVAPEVRALLGELSNTIVDLDGVHQVAVAKLVNNVAMLGAASSTLEALDLGIKSGLPAATLFRVLKTGTGRSYTLEHSLSRAYLDGDTETGYAARLALKDALLALDAGASAECEMPHTRLVCEELTRLLDSGGGDESFAMIGTLRGIQAPDAVERPASASAGIRL